MYTGIYGVRIVRFWRGSRDWSREAGGALPLCLDSLGTGELTGAGDQIGCLSAIRLEVEDFPEFREGRRCLDP